MNSTIEEIFEALPCDNVLCSASIFFHSQMSPKTVTLQLILYNVADTKTTVVYTLVSTVFA